jgi:hypothetical protein
MANSPEAPPMTDFCSPSPPRDSNTERRPERMYTPLPNLLAPNVNELERFGIPTRPREPPQPSFASASGPIGGADSGYQSHFNYNPASIQTTGPYRPYNLFFRGRKADREDGWTSSSTDSGSDGSSVGVSSEYSRRSKNGRAGKENEKKKIDRFGGMAIQGGRILYNSKADFQRWCGLFTHMRLTNKMTELINKSSFSDSNSALAKAIHSSAN